MHVPLVVNARTDIYLLTGGNPDADYYGGVRRLIAFRDAGADCVFVPGSRCGDDWAIGEGGRSVR